MNQTLCQCEPTSFPFQCERHGCIKTEHWKSLCETRKDYFQLWEEGRGPGQSRPDEPGLLRKAANYGKAVAKHVATGQKIVNEETYQQRLEICRGCSSLDQEKMVCREKSCGCFVEKKARWASQKCPLEKWLSEMIDELPQDDQPPKPTNQLEPQSHS